MEVIWQPKSTKQLLKIGDRKLRIRIVAGVNKLHDWPHCSNTKPLNNHRYEYRLRIGDWRVLFDVIEGNPVIIEITEVKKRDDRTY